MASSSSKIPLSGQPFGGAERRRGPLGHDDDADPWGHWPQGDTPGPLGIHDHGEPEYGPVSARALVAQAETEQSKQARKRSRASVLTIRPDRPRTEYPKTLSAEPDLIAELRALQSDSTVPGQPARIERSGIITRDGNLLMLTQEEQLAMVGNAAGQSPTLSKRIAHFRESSGLVENQAEISVHTHPHREPPSDTDVALTAETTRKSRAHSKRLAVNRDAMYLLIATRGTQRLMKSKFHGEWKEMRAAVKSAYQSHSPRSGPSGAGERMLHAMEQKALAAASEAKLVVYKQAGSSSTFERLVP